MEMFSIVDDIVDEIVTCGRVLNPRKAIITAPVGLHVKLNTMEGSAMFLSFPESNIDIGPIYIDWYRYT